MDMSRNAKLLGPVFILVLGFPLTLGAQITFERTYGGIKDDRGYSVRQTSDGGYIITGWTESFGAGERNLYLIKTDAYGDTIWTSTYNYADHGEGYSVQQTSDGGYVAAGTSDGGDVYLLKTDANGDTLWSRNYNSGRTAAMGENYDEGHCVQQTSDGGYIIVGSAWSWGSYVYLLKIDANGDTLWTHTYGGESIDVGWSVQQTLDGGYIVAGETYSFGSGEGDVYLIKTDANGDTIWTRTYGGPDHDAGHCVQQTTDGGYIVTGITYSFGGAYLLKTDANGDTLWTRTYEGSTTGRSVQQTLDGGYIIAGGCSGAGWSDVYLLKTDANGNVLWSRTYGGRDWDLAYSVQQTSDGGYVIGGWTHSFGSGDVYLIKTDSNGLTSVEEKRPISIPDDFHLTQNFPNPFNSSTTVVYSIPKATNVELSIYDICSRLIRSLVRGKASAGTYSVRWDGKDNSGKEVGSGVYLYRLRAGQGKGQGDFVRVRKMVLVR